ncbi:hypothetical protein Ccrd_006830 [Cynara cardunculus var. scolymus]|uniref:SRP54-type proteins GTP-binding domain-containing protein n=1 Tax=Cynara cardunculus var. scolymus TaxID=59895 RepID=A0A103XIE9_CYNCS|nr:hypothetical protein Ccrd_006830 [Cynara cardunculus var. scolymus]
MVTSLSHRCSTALRDSISIPGSTTVFNHLPPPLFLRVQSPTGGSAGGGGIQFSKLRCSAAGSETGFFTKLGRLIKEKAKKDVEKIFSGGFSKTRDNLAVIDELLLYWNLSDTDRVLDELEEDALKNSVLDLLTKKGAKTELRLGFRKPAVIMIVGVNGGKLAHRLKGEGASVLMAAGDTFRAAASDQLEIWAERTGCEIVSAEKEKAKASSGRQLDRKWNLHQNVTNSVFVLVIFLSQAVKKGKEQGVDIVLCDTSGRLHTNYSLMEELIACKKAVAKVVPGAPNEILLVLDGTTGLNMLPQAREFNEVVGITGFILTKLDGSARGGCVVSVVDELGIPVKFVGVGEGVEDLQPAREKRMNIKRSVPFGTEAQEDYA